VSLTVDTVVPAQVTAATAADTAGDRRAGYRVMAAVRPSVVRYCRARLGRGAHAVDVARVVCRTVADTLPDTDDEATITAFVYRTAAAAVDAEATGLTGLPAQFARLPRNQREVLVLRVAVGLSLEQAAAALGTTPDEVRHVQHHALQHLRAV
jgi:RNA polymerase sigma-70 factor, ECF subfamily